MSRWGRIGRKGRRLGHHIRQGRQIRRQVVRQLVTGQAHRSRTVRDGVQVMGLQRVTVKVSRRLGRKVRLTILVEALVLMLSEILVEVMDMGLLLVKVVEQVLVLLKERARHKVNLVLIVPEQGLLIQKARQVAKATGRQKVGGRRKEPPRVTEVRRRLGLGRRLDKASVKVSRQVGDKIWDSLRPLVCQSRING